MFPYMIATENCALVHRWAAYIFGVFALLPVLILFIDGISSGAVTGLAVLCGLAALNYAISRGAKKGEPWARVLCGITGVLLLVGFPIGTLIGGVIS